MSQFITLNTEVDDTTLFSPAKKKFIRETNFGSHPLHEVTEDEAVSIAENKCEPDEHNYQYFGHDHNSDYIKCTICGHIEEE